MDKKIPYKIYLEEQEMPKQWYNVRADMKKKPAPLLNPATLQPVTLEELSGIFCEELAKQELDDVTAYFDIPKEIRDFYKMYRPAPLVRAYCLEKKLDTPAKIYYKFEGKAPDGIREELRECAKIISYLDQKMLSINEYVKHYHDDYNENSVMPSDIHQLEYSKTKNNRNTTGNIPDKIKSLFGKIMTE